MASYGIRVQKGKMATTPEQAEQIAQQIAKESTWEQFVYSDGGVSAFDLTHGVVMG